MRSSFGCVKVPQSRGKLLKGVFFMFSLFIFILIFFFAILFQITYLLFVVGPGGPFASLSLRNHAKSTNVAEVKTKKVH